SPTGSRSSRPPPLPRRREEAPRERARRAPGAEPGDRARPRSVVAAGLAAAPSRSPFAPDAPGACACAPTTAPAADAVGRPRLRAFARVQLIGELVNLRPSRARVYFELRDAGGAIPCAAWREDWEAIVAHARGAGGEGAQPSAASLEGMQVVVAGGCDYYPGSATSSPGFSFAVTDLRVAGEGDLLARGPAVLLRRDPVPHGRPAQGAGDRVGRPSHRPHRARRRGRDQLLDAHARRRGGGGRALPARARGARRLRGAPARSRSPGAP